MNETAPHFSRSEEAGLQLIPEDAKNIYSVGVSTAGIAEIRMAQLRPEAHITATTLDETGAVFSREMTAEAGLSDQIDIRLENVVGPLPYDAETFDYVYARLILHYLSKQELLLALAEPKSGSDLFVVVRSVECPEARAESSEYDAETGLTKYIGVSGDVCYRLFHTPETISTALTLAGFAVRAIDQYDEQLFLGYERQKLSPNLDNVIQVTAQKKSE